MNLQLLHKTRTYSTDIIIPRKLVGSAIGLQSLVSEKVLPESNFQVVRNKSVDKNWKIPTRILKKSETNYPRLSQLFLDGNESNVVAYPKHIEPFILPLVKLEVNYCSHNQNSDTLREYLSKYMIPFALQHPSVEFLIRPKFSKPPQAIATYNTGAVEVFSLKKKTIHEIHETLKDIRNGSGLEPKKFHIGVKSHAPALRSLWDPWHGASLIPFDGTEQTWRRQVRKQKEKTALHRKDVRMMLLKKYSSYYDDKPFISKQTVRKRYVL